MANSPEEVDCERLGITVLLVDDDTATLSTNASILRSWEYKVATATSGYEALRTLRKFKGFFDLVITDLNMRGMNGFELQKRVKCEFHLPVIIMSAEKRKSVMSRSLEHGAAYYIVKPVRREDLKDVWQYAVAGRREKLRVENDRIVSVSEEEGKGEGDSPPPPALRGATTTTPPKKKRRKYCKRKRSEVIDNEELIFCGQKRSKIFWTTNLHNRFLLALSHIGMDKAVPTKILEIMNVPGLTRDNVASHLQKYRMFLKKVADKGILEGLSERALRSRFAMGLPTHLIRDLQKRVRSFLFHDNYYHQPYSTVVSRPATTRPHLANQTRLVQPDNYGTNHTYRNFQQSHYHQQANHLHCPIVNGGFMTSANALTTNGLSNDSSMENNRNFNCVPTNYDNDNNHGMIVPHGSSGLQRRSAWTCNNYLGTQLNKNNNNSHGMIVPYRSSGLQPSASTYNNHLGTQLNNNVSLTFGVSNRVHNVGYTGHNNNNSNSSSDNNIFGLLSNGSASNNAFVPISSSVVSVCVEPNRANISAGFPSLPQKSTNGIRNFESCNHNIVTSVNQQEESDQMDEIHELFLMIEDMVLPDETTESPRAGVRSSSDILCSFNVEYYTQLGDGDNVNAQTSERSINVLANKSSFCTSENPNMEMRNDASLDLEPLNMFVEDKANSPSENSTPLEQDWDMDLLETLFGAVHPSQK